MKNEPTSDELDEHLDEPIRPKSIVPPMRKSSGGLGFRILTLVAMLLMVIVAMHEAGKPERWEWMGFDQSQPTVRPKANDAADPEVGTRPDSEAVSIAPLTKNNPNPPSSQGHQTASTISQVTPDYDSMILLSDEDSNYPKVAADFWRSVFRKMNPTQQKTFLKLLRTMRDGKRVLPEQQQSCQELIVSLGKNRDRFHQQLFDQVALSSDIPSKKQLTTGLFDSQAIWDKKVFPALTAAASGEDFTLSQLRAIHQLQNAIDPILLEQVEDKTAIGWAGDSAGWNRLWEKVVGQKLETEMPEFESASNIQLMSQPGYYRGKPITIEGWVRSARKNRLKENSELALSEQYTLWVRPKETKLGIYCVYAHELPEGFPKLSEQFQDLNEQVSIDGYFFKLRTYVAADKAVKVGPVVLASRLTRIAPEEFLDVGNWQPSRTTLIFAFFLMPLIATGIAWWVFRFSRTRPYRPGGKTSIKITQTLGDLKSDPRVQTDQEKIMALYENEDIAGMSESPHD